MAECLTVTREIGKFESERELRRQICKTVRKMYAHGFVVACEGNLSVRLDRDRILVTPAGACQGHLGPRPDHRLSTNGDRGTIRDDPAHCRISWRAALAASRGSTETDRGEAALCGFIPGRHCRGTAYIGDRRRPGRQEPELFLEGAAARPRGVEEIAGHICARDNSFESGSPTTIRLLMAKWMRS